MFKTKDGEKITLKEALKRFKKGVDDITPIQKLTNEARGTLIQVLGYMASLVAVIYTREKIGLLSYGLILIFLGSVITTGLRWLALRQQLKLFKDIEMGYISDLSKMFNNEDELFEEKLNGR